ncbi:MAG: hypothetical protein ABMA64_07890 [Myxococcota bacterium]
MDDLDVPALQQEHLDLQRDGMKVLLGWSVVNLAGGGIGAALADTPRADAFWLGTAGWNVVNAGIAGAGLATLPARRRATLDVSGVRRQADTFERTLLVNIGLDVAYLAASGWLIERGRRVGDDQLRGLGTAVLAQGGFLLVYDSTLYAASTRKTAPLR